MKKILLIVTVVIGLGMLNGTGILFPSEVKACGGSANGHNHGNTGYQGSQATQPPRPYSYYGNPPNYNQVPQGDGSMRYGGGTGYNRGPGDYYSEGTQGHQSH
jgi:hypothetical protein